jgi:hypothetical protein
MRYEDTTNDAKRVITELFQFMLDQQTLEGTVLEKRINETTGESSDKRAIYGLKSNVTLNRNIHLYNDEQKEYIKNELKDFLHFFGYVDHSSNPDNLTPFFTYNNQTEQDLINYNGFKKHNAEVLAKLGQKTEIKTLRIGAQQLMESFKPNPIADRITAVFGKSKS